MKLSKEEKLQNKILKSFENQKFYSSFESSLESVKYYFIISGGAIGAVGAILEIIPLWLFMGCLFTVFAPIISITFCRAMDKFYKDRGEYLKEKLEKLQDKQNNAYMEKETEKQNGKNQKQTSFIKNKIKEKKSQKNKQKNTYHNNEESKDDGLDR